jgi:hypothetical protein
MIDADGGGGGEHSAFDFAVIFFRPIIGYSKGGGFCIGSGA